jgi:hypothetical protein
MKLDFQHINTYRKLGAANLFQAFEYSVRLKLGYFTKRLPIKNWEDCPDYEVRSPFPPLSDGIAAYPSLEWAEDVTAKLESGQVLWFSNEWKPRHESWVFNEHSGQEGKPGHWSQIAAKSGAALGDLKLFWEPSRFDWVYQLMRCHAAGDSRAEGVYGKLVEDWRAHNPPNNGLAWQCGQECAFRLIALVQASRCFASSHHEGATIAELADRIVPAMDYAKAQNNNHAISEATALFAAGLALPDHADADKWRARGAQLIKELCAKQFAADGGYVQHSFIYERLAMRLITLYISLAETAGLDVPGVVRERLGAAWRFLHAHQDELTGRVPNYGANDGANPLSLSGLNYLDFRPALAAAAWAADRIRIYEPGPSDEEPVWLGGDEFLAATPSPQPRKTTAFKDSGHYVLRQGSSFAMMRCHAYKTRPGQSDSLHVDLWMNGRNILRDAGSWRYYSPSGEEKFFSTTAAHNTVEVNSRSHMPKISTFLYADWVQDRVVDLDLTAPSVTGETRGYESEGVVHRRTLSLDGDVWTVRDELDLSRPAHEITLRWRLDPDLDWSLQDGICSCPEARIEIEGASASEIELVTPDSDDPEAWESLHYDDRNRIYLLRVRLQPEESTIITTCIRPSAS